MKTATLKQNISNKVLAIIASLILVMSNTAFAAPGGDGNGEGKGKGKKVKTLSADELALFQTLENEHKLELATLNIDALETVTYKKVLVYDITGKLLQEQDGQKTLVNLNKLPKNAKLLLVDNQMAIYVVM